MPGWERARSQIESGAIDAVGTKETAKEYEAKEIAMSTRGVGCVAANESHVKNSGENQITGPTDDGEGVTTRAQRADAKKASRSARKLNLRGNVVALDGH